MPVFSGGAILVACCCHFVVRSSNVTELPWVIADCTLYSSKGGVLWQVTWNEILSRGPQAQHSDLRSFRIPALQ
jgi:hypothetical protein